MTVASHFDVGRLSRLFDEALAVAESARAAWLDALPTRDAALRKPLRQMLEAQARGATSAPALTLPRLLGDDSFDEGGSAGHAEHDGSSNQAAEGGASGRAAQTGTTAAGGGSPSADDVANGHPAGAAGGVRHDRRDGRRQRSARAPRRGELIGPWRLLSEIGRGGMGSVWLAERADGAYTRQVALKLPRLALGPGLAQRMAQERDIGARLEHPHIARLYDAGVDQHGRPFLALERIEGEALDTHCSRRTLDVAARLRLFLQVLRAVAYAHGMLVVHRDIKPGNVLVDAQGQAHLLDFGIAGLLDHVAARGCASAVTTASPAAAPSDLPPESPCDVLPTALSKPPAHPPAQAAPAAPMTLLYAAPEQILGQPIGVAADVYSLGVMLYELLTDCLPNTPQGAGRAAMTEAILHGDIAAASVAARRSGGSPARARRLQGDIDAILARALQRNPAARYASAEAMARDIEDHLADRRIAARPDTRWRRLGRTWRHHRAVWVAAAAITAAVLAGSVVSVTQARRAEHEAARARIVKEFVVDIFKVNERASQGNVELRQLPAEQLLERGAALIETRFKGQPDLQAELFGVVARILLDMGASTQAAHYGAEQLKALQASDAAAPARARTELLLARALQDDHLLERSREHAAAALALAAGEPVLQLQARLLRAAAFSDDRQHWRATTELDAAEALLAGQPALSDRLPDRLQNGLKNGLKKVHADGLAPSLQAELWFERARILADSNRYDIAEPLFAKAIAVAEAAEARAAAGANTGLRGDALPARRGASMRLQVASHLAERGRHKEAQAAFDAAFAAMRASGGPDDVGAAMAEADAAFTQAAVGTLNYGIAEAVVARNLETLTRQTPRIPAALPARLAMWRGCLRVQWGLVESGYAQLAEAVALLRRLLPQGTSGYCLGYAAIAAGRHAVAERELAATLAHHVQAPAQAAPESTPLYLALATNRLMQGDFSGARAALEAAPAAPMAGAPTSNAADHYADSVTVARALVDLESGAPGAALQRLHDLPDSPFNMHDSGLVRGAAMCASGQSSAGLPRLAAAIDRLAARSHPHHPGLAHWRARAALCALEPLQAKTAAGKAWRVRGMAWARESRAALEAQGGVSPWFKAPLERLDRVAAARQPGTPQTPS